MDIEKYKKQINGYQNFFIFFDSQIKNGIKVIQKGNVFFLDDVFENFYTVGVTNVKKKDKKPFLVIQNSLAVLIKNILWDRAYFVNNKYLCFKTQEISSDNDDISDIESIILCIPCQKEINQNIMKSSKTIYAREMAYDDEKNITIDFSKKLLSVSLSIIEEQNFNIESLLKIKSIEEKNKKVLKKLASTNVFQQPKFIDSK